MAKMLTRLLSASTAARIRGPVRNLFCPSKQPAEYQVRLAYPCDYDRVMGFMVETYFSSEPSLVNAGLASQLTPTLMHQMYSAIGGGMTIIIEDRHTNCVVGASVNVDMRREDVGKQEKLAASCAECKRVKDLLAFYAFCSRQCDPWRNYCVDRLFECAYVAVHPKHQGKGLAKRLVEESWVLARDTAYRLFRIDCTSSYTTRLAESFGWQCVFRMPYCRYIADGGEFVFTRIVPPHTEMRIFVDQLNHYDTYYPPTKKRSKS
ncbi:uncharacterized protein LOC131671793 [Phymastichus coffea]|uniref:uncharacterized protein LOC131671793 n=1 Tax=Phymastichus coffea TaxID=108790 RepID=UPI00273C2C38|nr:uncharacterized protein LOC131671793 [Phymastichus coffea]